MKIQFNTGKVISRDRMHQVFFSNLIARKFNKYKSQVSSIEIHISDKGSEKEGKNDVWCSLEARIKGKHSITVSYQTDTIEKSVSRAIDNLKAALEILLGNLQTH